MNTYIIYIDTHIRQISLEAVRYLFLNLLDIGGDKFIIFLKRKNFEKWIKSFYGDNKPYKGMNTDIFPILTSDHCI